jgi:hypothetical protein
MDMPFGQCGHFDQIGLTKSHDFLYYFILQQRMRMTFLVTYWLEYSKARSHVCSTWWYGWKLVVAYVSWFNNKMEAKFSSYDEECLVIV